MTSFEKMALRAIVDRRCFQCQSPTKHEEKMYVDVGCLHESGYRCTNKECCRCYFEECFTCKHDPLACEGKDCPGVID